MLCPSFFFPLNRFLLLSLLVLGLSQCRQKSDPAPLTLLPPATQTGANTFGCLVNGQALTPQGNNGTANYDVLYDPTFGGGTLDVRAYQLTKQTPGRYLIFGGGQIDKPGTYSLQSGSDKLVYYADEARQFPCAEYNSNRATTSCQGSLTITRLDRTAGIVAGTFAFTLAQAGCDTIRVTEGRFDSRL